MQLKAGNWIAESFKPILTAPRMFTCTRPMPHEGALSTAALSSVKFDTFKSCGTAATVGNVVGRVETVGTEDGSTTGEDGTSWIVGVAVDEEQ